MTANKERLKIGYIDGDGFVTCPCCKRCDINTNRKGVVSKRGVVICLECGKKFKVEDKDE